jgi:hypothetical protein
MFSVFYPRCVPKGTCYVLSVIVFYRYSVPTGLLMALVVNGRSLFSTHILPTGLLQNTGLLRSEPGVQECDATMLTRLATAGYKKDNLITTVRKKSDVRTKFRLQGTGASVLVFVK